MEHRQGPSNDFSMPDREAISFPPSKEIRMAPLFPEAGEFAKGKDFLLQIWNIPYVLYSLDWEFCTGTSETYTCFLSHVYRDLSHELFISIFPITLQGDMGHDAHFYRWGRETERLSNLLTAIQLAGGLRGLVSICFFCISTDFILWMWFLLPSPASYNRHRQCQMGFLEDKSTPRNVSYRGRRQDFQGKVSKVNHTLLSALKYSMDQFQDLQIHNYSWHHL